METILPCLIFIFFQIFILSALDGLTTWMNVKIAGPDIETNIIAKRFIKNNRLPEYFIYQFLSFFTFGILFSIIGYCDIVKLIFFIAYGIIPWNLYMYFANRSYVKRYRAPKSSADD